MTGPVARKHVAGLMLEAAIREAPYSDRIGDRLLFAAAVMERGPDFDQFGLGAVFGSALVEAEPFIARAVQDLLGGWREGGEEIVRQALVTR